MPSPTGKKVDLLFPHDLYKAAKSRAAQADQPLAEWVVDVIRQHVQDEAQHTSVALDWGRIDDRIDQRTAALERQIELLTKKVEQLTAEPASQQFHNNYLASPNLVAP